MGACACWLRPSCITLNPPVKSPACVAKAAAKDEPARIETSPCASLKASIAARPTPVAAMATPEAVIKFDKSINIRLGGKG